MCLRWQVAIVHNVLMLTKCQFDPWVRRVGQGCGSWIHKQRLCAAPMGDNTDMIQMRAATICLMAPQTQHKDCGRVGQVKGRGCICKSHKCRFELFSAIIYCIYTVCDICFTLSIFILSASLCQTWVDLVFYWVSNFVYLIEVSLMYVTWYKKF